MRFEHGGEAALVFTPDDGGDAHSLAVLAFNLQASVSHDAHGSYLKLPMTRRLFLGSSHYYHCRPASNLDILVCEGAVGVGGACGRLLTFDPTGTPGFATCNVAALADLWSANWQVGMRGMLLGQVAECLCWFAGGLSSF